MSALFSPTRDFNALLGLYKEKVCFHFYHWFNFSVKSKDELNLIKNTKFAYCAVESKTRNIKLLEHMESVDFNFFLNLLFPCFYFQWEQYFDLWPGMWAGSFLQRCCKAAV